MEKAIKTSSGKVLILGSSPLNVDATIDSNIVAENIKSGVEILGVTGTYGESTNHTVQWVDFDGTVLKEETVADGGSSSAPSNPSHDYLTFDGWEKGTTLTGITEDMWNLAYYHVTDASKVYYGVNVPSGDEVFITLENSVKNVTFTIDWGDGTTETQAYASGCIQYAHTYSTAFSGYVTVSVSSGAISAPTNTTGMVAAFKNVETILIGNNHTLGAYDNGATVKGRSSLKGIILPVKTAATTVIRYTLAHTSIQFIHIPDCYTKLPEAFLVNCPLKDIVLPSTLNATQGLGTNVFASTDLTHLDVPDSVTTIPTSMVSECKKLKRVKLGNAVTILYQTCFKNCTNLTELNLPTTITTIGAGTFYGCENLSIEVNLPNLTSLGAGSSNAPFQSSGIRNITNLGSITSLPNYAFANTKLTTLNIPSTVTSAARNAFSSLDMSALTLPSSLTSMSGASNFDGAKLESLDLSYISGTFLRSSLSNMYKLKTLVLGAGMSVTYDSTAWTFYSLENISCGNGFVLTVKLDLSLCSKIPLSNIVSFFTNLGTYTGSNTITITLPTIILSRLTDEQKAIATGKGYVLA